MITKLKRQVKNKINSGSIPSTQSLFNKVKNYKVVSFDESFARIEEPSLTGKIMYKFADVFIVQWKELLKYFPKAKFWGGIF